MRAPEDHRQAVLPYFDAAYYRATHLPREADADPLDHFLLLGWREGYNPSRTFDVGFYLSRHLDVAAAGLNPLLHYAWEGQKEGREIRAPLGSVRACLAAARAPSARIGEWAGAADLSPAGGPAPLLAAMAEANHPKGIVATLSHDDYVVHSGGVQNAIVDEAERLGATGWGYLHLSPAAPLPILAAPATAAQVRLRVRFGGAAFGILTMQSVLEALTARGGRIEVAVHHLMGHAPEAIAELLQALGVRPFAWVHDFFTLCPSYALMRNDVRFCGAPPLGSEACHVCVTGADRLDHLPRIRRFFSLTRPFVLAPSQAALDLWLQGAGLPHAGAAVTPLGRLLLAAPEEPIEAGAPLRIAHLGLRTMHKGWTVFEDLAQHFAGDPRYAFYHLGRAAGVPASGAIHHVPVTVGPGDRTLMVEAIAEHAIDVALIWSLWPETFCFTVHEALAGGAFVLARTGAGNVWPAVQAHAPQQGHAVADEAALLRLFETGEIARMAAGAHRRRGALLPTGGAARCITQAQAAPAPRTPAMAGANG